MTPSSIKRFLAAALVLILPSVSPGLVAVPANALPGHYAADVPDPPPGLTLPWRNLGLDNELALRPPSAKAGASTTYTVPVPAGLTAVRLLGTIHPPMNIDAGNLEISDGDGKFLAAVPLPPASGEVRAPLDVDISGARVRSSSIDLTFTVIPADQGDLACRPFQQVTVSELATAFVGVEPPATTISSFFPPVLDRVTIYAATDADAAEKQAVLTLVSTLARLYKLQPLAITVVTQPRGATPPPAPQLARAIVVETGPTGISVEDAGTPATFLRVSGKGDSLTAQLSLFVNQLQSLVQTPSARVDQAGSTAPPGGDTLTFSQLKMSGKTNVLRVANFTMGVERSALGTGRVDSVQVHLLADYTPVADDDKATVLIRSKGIVVYRAALDDTGRLDATFDLERQTFDQWINLEFAFTYTPREPCGVTTAPLAFQVDPRSTLTMHRGGPPLDGFGAVPSEFNPGFMVAFDGSSPDQLSYAARVVAEVARLTAQPLTPKVVDLKVAADASTGALILASSANVKKIALNPPLAGEENTIDVGLPKELRVDMNDGLGSVQAFADRPHNRSVVLITTTGAWNLLDPLFDYIDGLNGGWSALTGDLLAAGAAGVPTNLAIRGDDATFEPPSQSRNRWVLIGIGVAVLAAIAILAATLWSSRRRPTAIGSPDDDEPVTMPGRSD